MNSSNVRSLIENEGMDLSMKASMASDFDLASSAVIDDANVLYNKLVESGAISALKKSLPSSDDSDIAAAVFRIAVERSGYLGTARAYQWLKRHAQI